MPHLSAVDRRSDASTPVGHHVVCEMCQQLGRGLGSPILAEHNRLDAGMSACIRESTA
jgi:hypothetical protein